jgi:hypothetical protein
MSAQKTSQAICQSCGYPLQKDKKGGGTNADQSKSGTYCSMCWENGKFTNPPEIDTAEKFQAYCIQEMKKDGMNGLFAWVATRSIPKLKRWKKEPGQT